MQAKYSLYYQAGGRTHFLKTDYISQNLPENCANAHA